MTPLENELGTALEAVMERLRKAHPHQLVYEIFIGQQTELAELAVANFHVAKQVSTVKRPFWHFRHRFSKNAHKLVDECVVCHKERLLHV